MNTEQAQSNSFEALYEITRVINSILEPDALLEKILEVAMAHLNAERGFVLLAKQDGQGGFSVSAAKNFGSPQTSDAFAASSSVVRTVIDTGTPVLTYDALTDERFEASTSIITQKILSIICIPLRLSNQPIGAVYLDSSVSRKAFTEESMKFLTVFGHLAAISLENAQRYARLQSENRRLQEAVDLAQRFSHLVGSSERWRRVLERMERVLDVDVAVLITGESGTGKELIARTIHDHGTRQGQPFVAVNCSAIPDQLLESEMFGYVRGAFTGASSDKKGLVEVAERGTLFLDEVADLPPVLQAKFLRLLQEREYRRVGDTKTRTADIRVIAATNRRLEEDVKSGRMREDLFFRLNVVGIHLPPLRERREDIPLLAQHFLRRAAEQYRRPVDSIHAEAMQVLLANEWRGNIRELQNTLERAVVLCRGNQLTRKDFLLDDSAGAEEQSGPTTLADFERKIIETTLAEMGGNRTHTAERLGVSLRWLQYRLKAWQNGNNE
jgi:Nif-specific regulatory protein